MTSGVAADARPAPRQQHQRSRRRAARPCRASGTAGPVASRRSCAWCPSSEVEIRPEVEEVAGLAGARVDAAERDVARHAHRRRALPPVHHPTEYPRTTRILNSPPRQTARAAVR